MCVLKNTYCFQEEKITMKKSTDKPAEKAPAPAIAEPIAPAAVQNPADVNLTIQDLTTALQIINVVTSRGAIKAEEMAVTGNLYNKLKAFLEASDAAKKAAEAEAEAAADATKDTTDGPIETPVETPAEEPKIGDGEK